MNQDNQMEKRKRRRKRAIIAVCVVVGLLIAIIAGILVWLHSWIDSSLINDSSDVGGSIPSVAQAAQMPEYTGDDVVYGLICGIDKEKDLDGNIIDNIGRTDMILYMKFNLKTNECNFLQIPRDTFVGEELNTDGTYKINALYFASEDPNNRMAPLLTTLMEQMRLPVDFYLTIDVDAMVQMVDAVFGVDVYVPQDLLNEDGTVMTQGWHKLMGKDAEYFLRHRDSFADQDIGRLLLQRNFYAALFKKLTELTPSDMWMWMRVLMNYASVGGLDSGQVIGLAIETLGIQSDKITFVRPAGNGQMYKGRFIFALDEEELADVLNTYFRPEGATVSAEEMGVYSLPPDPDIGTSQTDISTLGDVAADMPPQ